MHVLFLLCESKVKGKHMLFKFHSLKSNVYLFKNIKKISNKNLEDTKMSTRFDATSQWISNWMELILFLK